MTVQSGYVAGLKDLARESEQRQALINDIVRRCYSLGEQSLPPLSFVNIIGSDTYGHFKSAMCGTFSELMRRFKLTPASSILDIGSGCGRMAFPFSMLLTEGKYYGVDVWKEGVTWCNDHFAGMSPNIRFLSVESNNNYYFDAFKEGVQNDYSLSSISDASIDFAFAISCFSHLVERDCRDYVREIYRVLKPAGCAYITGFVIDRYFLDFVSRTGKHRAVKENAPGCFYAYQGQDFFCGFTPRKWREMLGDMGLTIVSSDVGSWAEKPGALNYQDSFVVTKR